MMILVSFIHNCSQTCDVELTRALLRTLELQVDYSQILPNPRSAEHIFFVSRSVSGMKKP